MKEIILSLLIAIIGKNTFAYENIEITKDFKVHKYACYIDSVGALNGAVDMIIYKANSWCDSLNGTLSRIGGNNLEIVIHDNSPAPGGCPGDVTVKSTFTCWTNTQIETD
ncbi:MAG: hypothetical protein QF441_09455 [Bacteriovoracaceae bacterium]|jgi:hypothetical protein|nr:hypothetical protein [Halobacteriovoraceae bacterium]MDP7320822.1 hypothetical protein [Bacteriovoracaceae bacterium]